MLLRVVLLAAAGAAAAVGYRTMRRKASPLYRRRIDLASLPRHVDNWLPKVPYVPCLRIGVDEGDLLEITGDGTTVSLHLLSAGNRRSSTEAAFTRACTRLGHRMLAPAGGRAGVATSVEIPAESGAVGRALDTVLREAFGFGASSRLIATVPAQA